MQLVVPVGSDRLKGDLQVVSHALLGKCAQEIGFTQIYPSLLVQDSLKCLHQLFSGKDFQDCGFLQF